MNTLDYVALLLAVAALFAYLNHYLLKLPRNSGMLVIALAATLALRLSEQAFPEMEIGEFLRGSLDRAGFGSLLLNGFLGFLLFSSALEVDAKSLFSRKWTILALATIGVLLSTIAIAAGMFFIFRLFEIDMPLSYCFAFGALLSPTDPVTVLDALRRVGVPQALQAVIAGESLFNDGVGIVLYTMSVEQATSDGGANLTVLDALLHFLREAGGGALLGLATGGVAFAAMRGIDEYRIEFMISLALATGTYGLAQTLDVSGPVAIVIAGLLMGSIGAQYAVSGTALDYLQKFWSLTNELLNTLLFLLIGLEFAAIDLRWNYLAAAGLAIPLALVVRCLSSTAAALPLNLDVPHKLRRIGVVTWSGLRGGISIALVLLLPPTPYRGALITACYGVVIFTMIVQGLSLARVASWLSPPGDPEGARGAP